MMRIGCLLNHLNILRKLKIICLLISCIYASSSLALQFKTISGNNKIVANLAIDELNRIAVQDDRILEVFVLEEDLFIEQDNKHGQIFVKPKLNKQISMTIVTEKGNTIDLSLIAQKIPAEAIIISVVKINNSINNKISSEHSKKITDIIVAMAKNQEHKDFTIEEIDKVIDLWDKIDLRQIKLYDSLLMHGEVYTIKNATKQGIYMTETQFAWKPGIVGVALKKHALAPDESTSLYIVRAKT